MIVARARAKVNLCLKVHSKRSDGYHELTSVMQSVDLFDTVSMDEAEQDSVEFLLAQQVIGPPPAQPDLAARALDLFRRRVAPIGPVAMKVAKTIPIGAGLGGGSADAAAVLVGANRMAGDPVTLHELAAIGAEIGYDVPFAVLGGTHLATGRGEELQDLGAPHTLWWVLGIPDFKLATQDVFAEVALHPSKGGCELLDPLRGGAVAAVGALLKNDLEAAAFRLRPDLARLKEAMLAAGSAGAVMSGSGSTIAGLCITKDHADEVAMTARLSFRSVLVAPSASAGAQVDA